MAFPERQAKGPRGLWSPWLRGTAPCLPRASRAAGRGGAQLVRPSPAEGLWAVSVWSSRAVASERRPPHAGTARGAGLFPAVRPDGRAAEVRSVSVGACSAVVPLHVSKACTGRSRRRLHGAPVQTLSDVLVAGSPPDCVAAAFGIHTRCQTQEHLLPVCRLPRPRLISASEGPVDAAQLTSLLPLRFVLCVSSLSSFASLAAMRSSEPRVLLGVL